ncbi:MAG: ComF family protein [Proteobacteria bacterium]|nr:ComF family protein [Pseudomonadota bacterium]
MRRGNAKKAVWRQAVDALLPPRCVVSGEIVGQQGAVAPSVWGKIRFIADPQCAVCGYPFEFSSEGNIQTCAACIRERPPFISARAALVYDDASRDMILKFKHGDQLHAAPVFIPWMERSGREMLAEADLIIPVPLHRWRFLKRRYNQAAVLAFLLARRAGAACIPDALVRRRATATQGHLDFRARHRNVRRAFAVHPRHAEKIAGKRVVLVDDVYTTGATIGECANTLLKAGAAEVSALTIARAVKAGG